MIHQIWKFLSQFKTGKGAAGLILSLPFITGIYDNFVLKKIVGSTDYMLSLYKIHYVLCSVRFVMQETTESPVFRKLYHMNMEIFFLSCTFITETTKDPESLKQIQILLKKVVLFFFHNFAG